MTVGADEAQAEVGQLGEDRALTGRTVDGREDHDAEPVDQAEPEEAADEGRAADGAHRDAVGRGLQRGPGRLGWLVDDRGIRPRQRRCQRLREHDLGKLRHPGERRVIAVRDDLGQLPVRRRAHEHDVLLGELRVDPRLQARPAVAPVRGRLRPAAAVPVNGAEHVDPQLTHGSSWLGHLDTQAISPIAAHESSRSAEPLHSAPRPGEPSARAAAGTALHPARRVADKK